MKPEQTAPSSKASSAEEAALWAEFWADPDKDGLRVRLVELYLPLVAKVSSMMPHSVRQHMSVEELMSAGVLGLHSAISSYSGDRNASFSTFAYKRIKGAMLDELRRQDRLTRTQRDSYKVVCSAINDLTRRLSRPPTDAEIAQETHLSVSEVDRVVGMGSEMVKLYDEFGDGLRYVDVLADTSSPSPEERAHTALAIDRLREHFRDLDEREQKILFLRHFEDLSVKEIATAMELSEGRISQIYYKTVLKLRALMKIS